MQQTALSEQVIKLFLNKGADVNVMDSYGNSPLVTAMKHQPIETIKLLLDNDAHIHFVEEGTNLLHRAVWNVCHPEVVQFLLDEFDLNLNENLSWEDIRLH